MESNSVMPGGIHRTVSGNKPNKVNRTDKFDSGDNKPFLLKLITRSYWFSTKVTLTFFQIHIFIHEEGQIDINLTKF